MHRLALWMLAGVSLTLSLSAQTTGAPAGKTSTLRNGDAVRVQISREPGLSGDFPVDDEGFISIPLLGRWRATETPWTSLRDSLLAAYRRELRSESIALTPLRRIYVLGSVLHPGVYMLDPTAVLQTAISLAGGSALDGNLERIRVQRDGIVQPNHVSLNTPPSVYDLQSGDQLFVERRSWLDRNGTLLLTSILSLAGIIATLATRR